MCGTLFLCMRQMMHFSVPSCYDISARRFQQMMKFVQKLGKALMLPVACLPLCGLLMGVGYLLCPASMQGGEISAGAPVVGLFLVKAGGALIDNMALLFAIGVGVGMSENQDGTGAVSALAAWLVITTLLSPEAAAKVMPSVSDDAARALAFAKIANPFIGILAGVIGGMISHENGVGAGGIVGSILALILFLISA